jgi:Haemolysin-III related
MNSSRDVLDGGHPRQINWVYDRAEIIADGVVHVIGACLGILGAVTIVVIAVRRQGTEVVPILVYVVGLLLMLALSAAYNMWPVSPAKWVLRRFDHSAIYFVNRRNLHAFPSPDEKRSGFSGSRPRSLAERRHWYGPQTRTSRSVRPLGDRALLAARVERCHCLRYACICKDKDKDKDKKV